MTNKIVENKVIRFMDRICCRLHKPVAAISMMALLAACNTSPQEVVIRDVTEPSRGTTADASLKKSVGINKTDQAKRGVTTREAIAAEVQPVYSASARRQSPLQKKILLSAQKKLSTNDPQGAIVLAEKGLRIDRKDPQFYIVLADAYARVENKRQSTYFAQQGLRYAQKDSQEYRALKRWIP
jgi:hypothetical protein